MLTIQFWLLSWKWVLSRVLTVHENEIIGIFITTATGLFGEGCLCHGNTSTCSLSSTAAILFSMTTSQNTLWQLCWEYHPNDHAKMFIWIGRPSVQFNSVVYMSFHQCKLPCHIPLGQQPFLSCRSAERLWTVYWQILPLYPSGSHRTQWCSCPGKVRNINIYVAHGPENL